MLAGPFQPYWTRHAEDLESDWGMNLMGSLLLVCPTSGAWSSLPLSLPSLRKTQQASSADKDSSAGKPTRPIWGRGCRNDGNGGQRAVLRDWTAVSMAWGLECRDPVGAGPGMGSAEIHSPQGDPPEECGFRKFGECAWNPYFKEPHPLPPQGDSNLGGPATFLLRMPQCWLAFGPCILNPLRCLSPAWA